MVEQMQNINTDGIEPMAHPHEVALRLREDEVTETDRAAEYRRCAGSTQPPVHRTASYRRIIRIRFRRHQQYRPKPFKDGRFMTHTLKQAGSLLQSKQISAVELASAYLAAIAEKSRPQRLHHHRPR